MNSKLMQIAAKRLKKVNIKEFEDCEKLLNGKVKDIDLVPFIFDEITKAYEARPGNLPFILGVIYYLYVPYKLHFTDLRAPNGIRQAIKKVMNWKDGPTVNYYAEILVIYFKNPRFAQRVEDLGNKIYNDLIEGQVIEA